MTASKKTTELLKRTNSDLETALNTLERSPVINYKKDREYLMSVMQKVIDRNFKHLEENIIQLIKEGAE